MIKGYNLPTWVPSQTVLIDSYPIVIIVIVTDPAIGNRLNEPNDEALIIIIYDIVDGKAAYLGHCVCWEEGSMVIYL